MLAEQSARRGRGRLAAMPGAGHNVSQHNPEAVAAELALFFLPLAGSRA